MTSLPALEVIATVTSVLVSFHPFGNAPIGRGAPGTERPVVRRQDLRVRRTTERVAERPPLAHAGSPAEAVAGEHTRSAPDRRRPARPAPGRPDPRTP